jgi:hypothetical protein
MSYWSSMLKLKSREGAWNTAPRRSGSKLAADAVRSKTTGRRSEQNVVGRTPDKNVASGKPPTLATPFGQYAVGKYRVLK